MPLIQIMGLSYFIYTMNIIDKKIYKIQRVASLNYPSTLREVKAGSIEKVLDGFAVAEVSKICWLLRENLFNSLIPFFNWFC